LINGFEEAFFYRRIYLLSEKWKKLTSDEKYFE